GYARAFQTALDKVAAVRRLTTVLAPDRIGLAETAEEVRRIAGEGRLVALMGMENGYGLGEDPDNLEVFADLGTRYLSLVHNGHNQLADSHTGEAEGEWRWDGLSPLGRDVVGEANRLGVVLDVSHPSKRANLQTMELSRAPVMASHSSVRALADHTRNMDDEQLFALRENGGVIQIVAFDSYLVPPEDEPATVSDLVDHVDYVVDLIGIDHVGISSDFDGGGGIEGWNDASETFNVTLELVRRGYTEEEIARIWSGNVLRVLNEARRVAEEM
ncbi:MAG: dipeptidase, partial [Gemmatimonadota bacterium]